MSSSEGPSGRSSWFLPAERVTDAELGAQVARATENPIVDAILEAWGSAVAVLNAERQILAINHSYLRLLGVTDPGAALGLRPGEAIGCTHAEDAPGGCGTSRACATCGTAVALAVSAAGQVADERDCVLTVTRGGEPTDLDLRIRAAPLDLDGARHTVLTVTDRTADRRRASLERAFLHDLSNLVAGLSGAADALGSPDPVEVREVADDVRLLATRLAREIQFQRALAAERPGSFRVPVERVEVGALLERLGKLFHHHPAATGKALVASAASRDLALSTDGFLLDRVLTNMLLNAFEATPVGGEVRLSVDEEADGIHFRVWNPGAIPAALAPRIFQRYFSTKPGDGRGQGTFVMKLFGERYLGGAVTFDSSPDDGTAFELRLPRGAGPPPPSRERLAHST